MDTQILPADNDRLSWIKPNKETFVTFEGFIAKRQMKNVILHGPHGAGKTAIIEAFLRQYYEELAQQQQSRRGTGRRSLKGAARATMRKSTMRSAAEGAMGASRGRRGGAPEPIMRLVAADTKHINELEARIVKFLAEVRRRAAATPPRVVSAWLAVDSPPAHTPLHVYA